MPRLRALLSFSLPGVAMVATACGDPTSPAPGACEAGLLPGDLVLTEIMVDPPGADSGREWFELYNARDTELDLRGVLLLHSREDGTDAKLHPVARSWMIPPDDYAVAGAVLDEPDVLAVIPYVDYGYADALGDMRNNAGRLAVACGDDVIDEVLYAEPTQGASRGLSGERTPDAIANDDLAMWCDATSELDSESLGTPGEPNDICLGADGPPSCIDGGEVRLARAPALGDVVITEVLANPEASEETQGEWFELYVGADIDLNGLAVGTDPSGLEADPVTGNDCIPVAAGTRLVFAREADPALNGGLPVVDQPFGFSLRNSDGQLVVSYGGEVLDRFEYQSAPAGAALSVDPDFETPEDNDDPRVRCPATNPYGAGDLGTPGAANEECAVPPPEGQCLDGDAFRDVVAPQPGDLAVTELLPNPEAVGDPQGEWFELSASVPFDLNGLSFGREEGVADGVVESEACLRLDAGAHAVIAREADPAVNGGLPVVHATFDFSLVNGDGTLWVGTDTVTLDQVTWSSSRPGTALSLDPAASTPEANDDEANFCDATAAYGDGDRGTPGAENPSCGGTPAGTCLDAGVEREPSPPQLGDLVITELIPNPAAVGDTDGEWFELRVNADVDLNGLQLGDDLSAPDTVLPAVGDCLAVSAGDRVVLARRADPAVNGGLPEVFATFDFNLTNAGGTLSVGFGGEALDTVTWSGSPAGASLSLDPAAEDPVANDDETNFCPSTAPYGDGDLGSPGVVGAACDGGGGGGDGTCTDGGIPRAIVSPAIGDLVITEFMPNPSAVDDGAGEWFELRVNADVDLNGLQLGNDPLDPANPDQTLPAGGDCLRASAGDRLLFARGADPAANGGLPEVTATFGFNLVNGAGALFVGIDDAILDAVTWSGSSVGAATSLDPGQQDPVANDDAANFCPAVDPYGDGDLGTPAAPEPACP